MAQYGNTGVMGDIGAVGNPLSLQLKNQLAAMPELQALARQFQTMLSGGTLEAPRGPRDPRGPGGAAPGTDAWASPMLQDALPRLMGQGMSGAEELGAKRNIADSYRSAVGAGGFAGGSAGAYSPRATRRVAFREAGQRLAPAMAALEAKKAQMRRGGLQAGVGALTSIYGPQMQAGARDNRAYGQLLGKLLSGVRPPRTSPGGTYTPTPSFGF
jgi:hypothetical protein